MANRRTYNPYIGLTGLNIDRFQGVYNDGLASGIPVSMVESALDADDRWRGAVKKRDGYLKTWEKNFPLNSIGKIFEGMFFQGEKDVWYRSNSVLDYKIRPGADDPYLDVFSGMSFGVYTSYGVFTSTVTDTFTGSPPTGAFAYSTSVDTWRFRHIALAIDQRRAYLSQAASGLPTNTPDASITRANINSARAFIQLLSPSFYKDKDIINLMATGVGTLPVYADTLYPDYHNFLFTCSIGGGTIVNREWSNVNSAGVVYYNNTMAATDLITSLMFAEMEIALKNLKNIVEAVQTYTFPPGPSTTYALTFSELPIFWIYNNNGPIHHILYGDNTPLTDLTSGAFGVTSVLTSAAWVQNGSHALSPLKLVTGSGGSGNLVMYQYKYTSNVFAEDAKLGQLAR